MARGPSKRVVIAREKLDPVIRVIADGLFEVGKAIVEAADPPDATPYGEGLVRNGGVLAYVGPDKVAGFGLDGKQPRKPRSLATRGRQGIVVVAGFGFPGRFNEFGTIHNTPNPFLSPAADSVLPRAAGIVEQTVRPALTRLP